MKFIQVDNTKPALLRRFFDLLSKTFDESEMDSWESWEKEADWSKAKWDSSRAKKLIVVAINNKSEILGGSIWEYFRASQHYLFTYLFVAEQGRGRGLAFQCSVKTWQAACRLEQERGCSFTHIFCEMHDPRITSAENDVIDPYERLRMFQHLGVRGVRGLEFFQPPLHEGDKPQPFLLGVVITPKVSIEEKTGTPQIEREALVAFICDYYHDLIGPDYATNPYFKRIMASVPQPAILPLHQFEIELQQEKNTKKKKARNHKHRQHKHAQQQRRRRKQRHAGGEEEKRKRVIIVGAGISGLACAQKLVEHGGFDVTVLEARNRIGGRIWSTRLFDEVLVEAGAAWFHGTEGNEFFEKAKAIMPELKLHPMPITSIHTALRPHGSESIAPDVMLEALMNFEAMVEQLKEEKKSLGISESTGLKTALELLVRRHPDLTREWRHEMSEAFRYILSKEIKGYYPHLIPKIESEENTHMDSLSALHFDSGDYYEGGDQYIVGGIKQILTTMSAEIDIRFKTIVTEIEENKEKGKVVVSTDDGAVEMADAAVLTVPLGVLKRGRISILPRLPVEKQDAISRLGFGQMDKVLLQYKECFWPSGTYVFGYNFPSETKSTAPGLSSSIISQRPRHNLFIFNLVPVTGKAVLVALITGDLQQILAEKRRNNTSFPEISTVRQALEKMFGRNPTPDKARVVRWGDDNFTHGAYTFMAKGAEPKDIETLAAPLYSGKLGFAGEHTSRNRYGYMDGAYCSGIREGNRLIKLLDLSQGHENSRDEDTIRSDSVLARERSNNVQRSKL